MVAINLKSLVERINEPCRKTLEAAAGLCLSRSNYNVEVEHWLAKLLELQDTDMLVALKQYDVDIVALQADVTRAMDRLRHGNTKTPSLSQDVVEWVRNAWLLASLEFRATKVRTGYLLLALLSDESLARVARDISRQFENISVDQLQQDLGLIMQHSNEVEGEFTGSETGGSSAASSGLPTGGKLVALDQFTTDLTARARQGGIDPVLGRDDEIRQIIDILTRRRQNNPILTGEAGVGKTAVVEGFALRIAKGDVPPALKNVSLRVLDLALLQAGAGVKGEFENRLKSVIQEVKSSPQPIILFIDEAHTMIGAGGSEGQGDAANLLKPALARGELRTIAATTWAEYKKYFEKDAALARRFQVVKVEEPEEQKAIDMMRGIAADLEKHHKVRILDEAIIAAVKLSKRYISGRQLPDKSVSLLDTACAKVAMGHNATPAAIEDLQRRIEQTHVELRMLNRETATGAKHNERVVGLQQQLAEDEKSLAALEARYEKEKELVKKIRELREQLENSFAAQENQGSTAQHAELEKLTQELATLQGETPLMQVCVDQQAIAEIIASWTGIPVGRMVSDEINAVLDLKNQLAKRVIGQDHALQAIAETIQVSRAGLGDPRKPIGVFMLAGTSGTGKTETALALADMLYGGEQNMTVINMSEFKEEHKVSMLVGSPPGYVGYGEGGVLTNAVRRRPYSVVLLDEMEKAQPGVQDIFYQVFDKGMIMDGEGREIDFKNTVIIMTTNAGTNSIMQAYAGDEANMPETAEASSEFPSSPATR
ncbi:MAG: type VI secretion system ATPase TssH [Gammaproteobacteria bacterium]|nr:type VI secretion system ATPase TssH [Gammaproteobacteria bacterium]